MRHFRRTNIFNPSSPSRKHKTILSSVRTVVLALICILTVGSLALGADSYGDNNSTGSYGFITRIQTSSKRVIFQTAVGAFQENSQIGYYNVKGELLCTGIIQSVYKDEIYSKVDDCEKFEDIRPGFVVALNGKNNEILGVYENKKQIEANSIEVEWNRLSGAPMDIGEERYDKIVLRSSLPVLVEFYTTWCPYCKKFTPILAEIAKDFEGKVRFATLDKEKNARLATEMGVKGVPAFYLIKEGVVLDKWSGASENKDPVVKYLKSKLKIK